MPEKITKVEEIKTNSDIYEIYLGTFNEDVFTWYSVKKIKDETEAYKEFKKYQRRRRSGGIHEGYGSLGWHQWFRLYSWRRDAYRLWGLLQP